jgi:hypothetical protein
VFSKLLFLGYFIFLIGLLGGGIKLKKTEIPQLRLWQRILVLILGLILMLIGYFGSP